MCQVGAPLLERVAAAALQVPVHQLRQQTIVNHTLARGLEPRSTTSCWLSRFDLCQQILQAHVRDAHPVPEISQQTSKVFDNLRGASRRTHERRTELAIDATSWLAERIGRFIVQPRPQGLATHI